MGAKIPREIRLQVIRKWLEGVSRDLIAHQLHIGAGTVSGIIKELREGFDDVDLLREVALNLKNRGLDIESFAPLVRLKHVLEEEVGWISGAGLGQEVIEGNRNEEYGSGNISNYGYDHEIDQFVEKKMESLIMSLEAFCYQQNLSVKQFFDFIHSMYLTAEKLGIPLVYVADYIKEQEVHVKNIKESVKYWEAEEQAIYEKYNTTEKSLKEFQLSRSLFDDNQELKLKLEQVTKERDKYKFDLESERFWNKRREEDRWSILESELDKANKDLGYRAGQYTKQLIDPKYLKEMVMDVYHNPSKYADIISKLMDRYDLEHTRKEEKQERRDDDK
jgi:Helix-turn-helix domain